MKDTLSYMGFAIEAGIKDDEVMVFTNHGVYTVKFNEFDAFHEHMEVSRGEVGLTNKYYLAITQFSAYDKYIWRTFTRGDSE